MQDTAELSTSARAWRALRRTTLVPMVLVVALVSAALLPLTLAAALLIDALRRRRWALTRTLLVLQIDAWVEAVAMLRAGLSWLRWFGRWQAPGYHQDSHQLELWWATTLLDAARRIYALELVAEGLECAATGPFLLLPRHVSIADTLLPIALLARRYGLEPRYVVKRELELDPVLDVVGHRLDTAFVARRGRDPEGDRARVARLAQGLGPEHFVVLYPEGTRFSRQKQARLVQKAREEHDDHLARRVARYQNTLPPHPGGTLELLAQAPALDVVFLAHVGFDGVLHLRDLLSGELVGRRVLLQAWRVDHEAIPRERAAQERWLDAQWARVDRWVGEHLGEAEER